jgi:hypothetical protein
MQSEGIDRRRYAVPGKIGDEQADSLIVDFEQSPEITADFVAGFEFDIDGETMPGRNTGDRTALGHYGVLHRPGHVQILFHPFSEAPQFLNHRSAFKMVPDACDAFAGIDRIGQDIIGAGVEAGCSYLVGADGGLDQNRQISALRIPAQAPAQFDAVYLASADIDHHQIGLEAIDPNQNVPVIADEFHPSDADPIEETRQGLLIEGAAVDHQNTAIVERNAQIDAV